MEILRAWAARVQYGYWTHSGMLSWDSGLGFKRWMKAKTWAYALQGPLAIAASPRFQLDPRQGPWAKYVFDRGLAQFADRCAGCRPRHLPSAHLYGVGSAYQGTGSRRLYVARMGANAVRAIVHGLGAMPADAAARRLRVRRRRRPPQRQHARATRPRSSCTTKGAFPYGGIELARLSDAAGVPVGGVGGRPPASFGVVVRRPARAARARLPADAALGLADPAALAARPGGARPAAAAASRRRPFERARGRRPHGARRRLRHRVVHRFTPDHIECTWTVEHRRRRLRAEVLFPSWGTARAITAVLRDGSAVVLAPRGRGRGRVGRRLLPPRGAARAATWSCCRVRRARPRAGAAGRAPAVRPAGRADAGRRAARGRGAEGPDRPRGGRRAGGRGRRGAQARPVSCARAACAASWRCSKRSA